MVNLERSHPWQMTVRAVGRAALRVDAQRQRRRERHFRLALAHRWQRRASIPSGALAIGLPTGREPLSALLAGLRLGTVLLRASSSRVDEVTADLTVEHDDLSGGDLRWVLRGDHDPPTKGIRIGPERELPRRDIAAKLGPLSVVVEDAIWTGWGVDADFELYATGTCRSLAIADRTPALVAALRSYRWQAWLFGSHVPEHECTAILNGVTVHLTEQGAPIDDPRQAGPARADSGFEHRALSYVRQLLEAAATRRVGLPPDFPPLVLISLTFPEEVELADAERFLLDDLHWLLSLHSGRWVVPGGIWHPTESVGRITNVGRMLAGSARRTVDVSAPLGDYLEAVSAKWQRPEPRRRLTLKIAISMTLSGAHHDLELSIAVTALGLEMLVEQLFGEDAGATLPGALVSSYGLTNAQKKPIKAALRQAIIMNVPDGDYLRDIDAIVGRLFWRTAKDKTGELLNHYAISYDRSELDTYIDVRNSITHGDPSRFDRKIKLQAMLFGQTMLSQCLLRELGWRGTVYDDRDGRLIEGESDNEARRRAASSGRVE